MYDLGCMTTRPTPNHNPPRNFQLGLAPPGKTVSVKNAVTLYYYAKDDCSNDQEKKKILLSMLTQHLIISILPFKVMINSRAPRNMEAITYTTQMMPSKEPVRLKLNTEARVGLLYLSFLEPNDITVNTTMYCGILSHYGEYHNVLCNS